MGNKITLTLDERELTGKKVAKLRAEGLIPAIVYGATTDPINVQMPYNVFGKVHRQAGSYAPVHLTIGDKKKIAMIKEVNIEPVSGMYEHVSFHAVKATDPVIAEVPIHLIGKGESEAEREGLIILQTLDSIEVRALPMDLPESIEISVADLKEAGEKLTLAAAKLDEGVEFVEHDDGRAHNEDDEQVHVTDQLVASVWEPSALQAANESAAGTAEDESEVESENGEAESTDEAEADKEEKSE
jgi:large subunit ribosomal protein L25